MRAIRATILFHGMHAVAGLQSGKPPPPVPTKTRVYRRADQQSGDPPPKPFLVSPNGVQVMNGQSEELMKKLNERKQKLTEQLGEDAEEQSDAQPTEREQPDEEDGRSLPLKQGRKPNWEDIEVSVEGVTPPIPPKKSSRSATNQLGLDTIAAQPDATKPVPKPRVTKSPPSTPTEDSQSKNPASTMRSRSPSPSGSKSRSPSPGSRARLPTPDELLQSTSPALIEKSRSRSPSPEEPRSPLPRARPRVPTPEEIRQSKSLQVYESLLQPQGFKCRVFHVFTTSADEKVFYELDLKGEDLKLYYNVLEGDKGPTKRKITATTSLERSGMPYGLPRSQPSDCKATMRDVLKYAWNYASGRFRPKEGGALNESSVQQEFSWQLELDSNDKWISFGGKNSYAMPSSLGSDVLTKFAKKVFPEKDEPLKLPDMPESLWYLEMEGKDLSMALNRDFTIHRIRLPGMPIRWKGMTAAISELSGIKGDHSQEEPKTSEDIAKNAFGSYLEAICLEGSRSSEGTFNGETMTVWPFGKEVYDKCNKNNFPIPIPAIIFEPGAMWQSRENAFQVSARSRLAKAMEVLELFARRHVVN
ncbi:hypothetical protein FOZ61_003130 [Perkinsus olseni]|uniref:Sphingosine kinase 2 n=1 Tax=Perkinsus olseni TaxID=32597 RepID=A0A7J6LQF7_PEROL|nr:hypothetical protein FOZ61_003130 [Perkinsus olseni]